MTVADCFTCLVLLNVRLLLQWVLSRAISSFRITHWFNKVSCLLGTWRKYTRKAKRIEDVPRLSLLSVLFLKLFRILTTGRGAKCRLPQKHDELSSQNYIYCTPNVLDLPLTKMRLREIIEIKTSATASQNSLPETLKFFWLTSIDAILLVSLTDNRAETTASKTKDTICLPCSIFGIWVML